MIKHPLRGLLASVQYFTRVPVPSWIGHERALLQDVLFYFPIVGLLVGAIAAFAYEFAHWLWPQDIAILIALAAGMLLTGGFHEDGLANSFDGFGGAIEPARVLEIMKDPRLGTLGVLGLVMVLLLKFAALAYLRPGVVPWALIAGHGISRSIALSLVETLPYVRPGNDSRARAAAVALGPRRLLWASLPCLLPLLPLGWSGVLAVLLPIALRLLAGRYLMRRIGGYTGDCLGAMQQLGEAAFYLALV